MIMKALEMATGISMGTALLQSKWFTLPYVQAIKDISHSMNVQLFGQIIGMITMISMEIPFLGNIVERT
jgi:hypothetical protein